MAKIIIKESEIRNYVRALIREAYQVEAATNSADIAEREKMLAGKPYDRSKFPLGGKSFNIEREYRQKMGYAPLKKPKGGIIPRLIDANGNDITPENSPENIQTRVNKRTQDHKEKMGNRYIKKNDRQEYIQNHGLNDDDAAKLTHDSYANNLDADPYAQRMLAMSPEERAEEAERIRKERIAQSIKRGEEDERMRKEVENSPHIRYTKQSLLTYLQSLKDKQAELGDHCDANDKEWNEYERIIKHTQNILKQFYGVKNKIKNDYNEDDENINFIEDGGVYDGSDENQDEVIDASQINKNNNSVSLNSLNPRKRKRKQDRFDDVMDMGYYDIDNMFSDFM